jgi:hypothetical protein
MGQKKIAMIFEMFRKTPRDLLYLQLMYLSRYICSNAKKSDSLPLHFSASNMRDKNLDMKLRTGSSTLPETDIQKANHESSNHVSSCPPGKTPLGIHLALVGIYTHTTSKYSHLYYYSYLTWLQKSRNTRIQLAVPPSVPATPHRTIRTSNKTRI